LQKYLGIYAIFYEKDINTNQTIIDKETNETNQYLQGNSKTIIYRYDENTLAIYFPSNQTIGKLDEQNIKYSILCQGDTESILLVDENKYIDKLDLALKIKVKGRLEQLKEYKRQQKLEMRLEKEKEKANKKK